MFPVAISLWNYSCHQRSAFASCLFRPKFERVSTKSRRQQSRNNNNDYSFELHVSVWAKK